MTTEERIIEIERRLDALAADNQAYAARSTRRAAERKRTAMEETARAFERVRLDRRLSEPENDRRIERLTEEVWFRIPWCQITGTTRIRLEQARRDYGDNIIIAALEWCKANRKVVTPDEVATISLYLGVESARHTPATEC